MGSAVSRTALPPGREARSERRVPRRDPASRSESRQPARIRTLPPPDRQNMRLYLDCSVYAFIDERRERAPVEKLLRSEGAVVRASISNVLEAAAIQDDHLRRVRARTIGTIADEFETPPTSYLEAHELLNEIRRCRAEWLRKNPSLSSVKRLLRSRARQWQGIQAGHDPMSLRHLYGRVVDPLAMVALERQRPVRQAKVRGACISVVMNLADVALRACVDEMPPLERYVRVTAMEVWAQALNGRPNSGTFATGFFRTSAQNW